MNDIDLGVGILKLLFGLGPLFHPHHSIMEVQGITSSCFYNLLTDIISVIQSSEVYVSEIYPDEVVLTDRRCLDTVTCAKCPADSN